MVLLVTFLISCTSEDLQNTFAPAPAEPKWGSIQPKSKIMPPVPNAGIVALLEKNKDALNYRYFFDAGDADGHDVLIYRSKAKKIYTDTKHLRRDIFYDTVYLNLETRTAVATCEKSGSTCSPLWHQAYNIPYEKLYPTPVEIAQEVNEPIELGSEVLMNRALTIIEYINAKGKRERLSLDNFYGLPSRQVIYSAAGEVEESHMFTRLSVGQVQEEEVTLPRDYIVVE